MGSLSKTFHFHLLILIKFCDKLKDDRFHPCYNKSTSHQTMKNPFSNPWVVLCCVESMVKPSNTAKPVRFDVGMGKIMGHIDKEFGKPMKCLSCCRGKQGKWILFLLDVFCSLGKMSVEEFMQNKNPFS